MASRGHKIARSATALCVLSLLALTQAFRPAQSTAEDPCPDPGLWAASLWSAQGHGPGSLRDGVKGLEFANLARRPIDFIQVVRMYANNAVAGYIQVSSVIRETPPYTFTWALSDQGDPVQGEVALRCYYEVPEGVQSEISGVVVGADCGLLGTGRCYFYIEATTINGYTCP